MIRIELCLEICLSISIWLHQNIDVEYLVNNTLDCIYMNSECYCHGYLCAGIYLCDFFVSWLSFLTAGFLAAQAPLPKRHM